MPKELYESASVDGANGWRSFLNVTVPGVRTATTLVVILAIITGGNLFTEPYLLTNGGGPDGSSWQSLARLLPSRPALPG